MERTLASEVSSHIGQTVTVEGWLHKKRLLGGLNFITLRDRTGLVQTLIENKEELEKLRGMQIGTVLKLTGESVGDERAPGGAELHNVKVEVLVPVEFESPIEIDKPLNHQSENLDTLFDMRPIGLRNVSERAIFEIQATVCRSIRRFLDERGFSEIHTPKLLAEPTEGGAEVFKLDYFGKLATLAQSPQFYKQIGVGIFERVYEIAPVYRAELSATTRHMTEFISIDAEMGFITLPELRGLLSQLLNYVIDDVWKNHETELKRWNANKPTLTTEIPVLSMNEIHEKYSHETGENSIGEKDLRPDEERWACDYAKKKG
jgi:nondiscriminating aspartyl-tRNA synthetase